VKPPTNTSFSVRERDTIPEAVCTNECPRADKDVEEAEEEEEDDDDDEDSSTSGVVLDGQDSGYSGVPVVRSYWCAGTLNHAVLFFLPFPPEDRAPLFPPDGDAEDCADADTECRALAVDASSTATGTGAQNVCSDAQ
jgi:hypothetical protein